MIFFAVLIVLAVIQLRGANTPIQRDEWLTGWLQLLTEKIDYKPLRLTLLIAVPFLAVALLDTLFSDVLFGLLSLVFYVLVLLYSLGRGDFNEAVEQYLMSWRAGNYESAFEYAKKIGDFEQSDLIADPQALHDKVRAAILYEGYQRWFAVIFWFLVLGPAGALAYRVCYQASRLTLSDIDNDEEPMQQQVLLVNHYLDWLPARLLAFAFALTGRFESTFERCVTQFSDNKPVSEIIDSCACAALHDESRVQLSSEEDIAIEQGEREITGVQSLLSRTVICWLVFIALLQMIF